MRALGLLLAARTRTRPETGASSVEYGLLAVLIAAVIVIAVVALGQSTGDAMGSPCDSLAGSSAAASCP